MSRRPNVWRMFAGENHFQWQFWLEAGVMSIGWGTRTRIIDLDDFATWEELAEEFRPHYETNRRARFAARQLWRFMVEANNGDIVFVYDEGSILGVGLIVGEVDYVDDEMCRNDRLFAYRRDVDWLSTKRRKLSKKQIERSLKRPGGSIYRIEDERLIEQVIQWSELDRQDVEDMGDSIDDTDLVGEEVDLEFERVDAGTRKKRNRARVRRFLLMNNIRCQVCGLSIELPNGKRYAEVHHIQPLGRPHNGVDRMVNMLCLCPNHHAEMDRGAFYIEDHSRKVVHFDPTNPIHGSSITSISNKWPASQFLKYQKEKVCKHWVS